MFISAISMLLLLVFSSTTWADKICIKEIDGQKVYTNLCDREKTIVIKKQSKATEQKTKMQFINISNYTREQLERIVEEKSKLYGVDPKLIKEVIKEESNWNIYATSPKGAMGIMQLMPSTALLMGVDNPYDPEQNIDGGIRYMKYLLERFNGNLNLALAAYNAGPNLVESIGRIPNILETQRYVERISMRYNGTAPSFAESAMLKKKSAPIRAVILSDGTVLYTNREDIISWTGK